MIATRAAVRSMEQIELETEARGAGRNMTIEGSKVVLLPFDWELPVREGLMDGRAFVSLHLIHRTVKAVP